MLVCCTATKRSSQVIRQTDILMIPTQPLHSLSACSALFLLYFFFPGPMSLGQSDFQHSPNSRMYRKEPLLPPCTRPTSGALYDPALAYIWVRCNVPDGDVSLWHLRYAEGQGCAVLVMCIAQDWTSAFTDDAPSQYGLNGRHISSSWFATKKLFCILTAALLAVIGWAPDASSCNLPGTHF